MSELEALTSTTPTEDMAPKNADVTAEAFSFGDPIPVLDRRELLDYVECVQMDRWYEPPVSFDGLARTYRAAVHHSSPIAVKRNILTSTFIPHPLLSQQRSAGLCRTIWYSVMPIWRSAPTDSAAFCRWSHHWRNTPAAGSI